MNTKKRGNDNYIYKCTVRGVHQSKPEPDWTVPDQPEDQNFDNSRSGDRTDYTWTGLEKSVQISDRTQTSSEKVGPKHGPERFRYVKNIFLYIFLF